MSVPLLPSSDEGGGFCGAKDGIRTTELEKMNLKIIRFCNLDIDSNFYSVCEAIDSAVKCSLPQSPTVTAPSSEGAETV